MYKSVGFFLLIDYLLLIIITNIQIFVVVFCFACVVYLLVCFCFCFCLFVGFFLGGGGGGASLFCQLIIYLYSVSGEIAKVKLLKGVCSLFIRFGRFHGCPLLKIAHNQVVLKLWVYLLLNSILRAIRLLQFF